MNRFVQLSSNQNTQLLWLGTSSRDRESRHTPIQKVKTLGQYFLGKVYIKSTRKASLFQLLLVMLSLLKRVKCMVFFAQAVIHCVSFQLLPRLLRAMNQFEGSIARFCASQI
ncbi:hypothetical protein PROAA_20050 [Candidatus Propionivibrio aalborgensis]|uniref:Uncharacterized protein n=1 Tax=Candidatus Propionivibrio aalborgensis TaxID=1860101 RepID=A0A1A8XR33_9RHOO|nr:hypothetical protein PROAA_20050 [Candidatus Propionivibrio aalborgensis]